MFVIVEAGKRNATYASKTDDYTYLNEEVFRNLDRGVVELDVKSVTDFAIEMQNVQDGTGTSLGNEIDMFLGNLGLDTEQEYTYKLRKFGV